ncbi:flagellar biosynthetic protein FliO [Niveibacterium sp. SC-1]|uniref:flagellar biosynthetic protein FliO n=1 Tax=Niveibacterium sp. SC-1 TaxID=3135646 RepID=UPI00311E7805
MRLPPALVALPIFLSTPALAAAETPAGGIASMLLGLLVVLALLYGLMYVLKRVQSHGGAQSALRVIGGASVGPRERVVLVEVAGKVLVLGVAPGSVTALDQLPAEQFARTPADTSSPAAGKSAATDFASRLAEMLRKPRND